MGTVSEDKNLNLKLKAIGLVVVWVPQTAELAGKAEVLAPVRSAAPGKGQRASVSPQGRDRGQVCRPREGTGRGSEGAGGKRERQLQGVSEPLASSRGTERRRFSGGRGLTHVLNPFSP